jgi:hypothetical protein
MEGDKLKVLSLFVKDDGCVQILQKDSNKVGFNK